MLLVVPVTALPQGQAMPLDGHGLLSALGGEKGASMGTSLCLRA